MLVLSSDDVPANPLAATGRQAGIDVGVVTYAHAISSSRSGFFLDHLPASTQDATAEQ